MEEKYGFPAYRTQGGGLVQEVRDGYEFVEKPDCPGYEVGDRMPGEWGIVPANDRAQDQIEEAELGPVDRAMVAIGLNEFFATLLDGVEAGRFSPDQAGQFFPEAVRKRNS